VANARKRRGSLTIRFDPAMIWEAAPTGRRGRQPDHSDAAIQTCLTMKVLFGMGLLARAEGAEGRHRPAQIDQTRQALDEPGRLPQCQSETAGPTPQGSSASAANR